MVSRGKRSGYIVGGLIAVAAAVGIGIFAFKKVAASTTLRITSVTPNAFASAGGSATVIGTSTLPDGTLIYAYVNGAKVGSAVTITGGAFSTTVPIAANTMASPVSDTIQMKNV